MDLETAQTNCYWQSSHLQTTPLNQENGNSFKPTVRTTANADGTSTSMIPGPVTTEEKAQKKNNVKARRINQTLHNEALMSSTTTSRLNLEQIHEDDLEEIGFEVEVSFTEHESKKVFLENWECRGPRNQDNKNMNQDNSRRTVNMEETSSKAMVAIDGASFDWSFMANEEVPTNMDLMAFLDSEAHCNYHQREGMVNENNYTRVNYNYSAKKAHPNSHRNMTPRAVLMKTGLKPLNTARPVNTAHPKTTVYRARPMSCNMSYLSDFKEFNGGYVTFGGGARGGRITGKGSLKTGKLGFKDVYFVKELQTEFKNRVMNEFCEKKDIKREFSIARTPQQNGFVERRNRTLIEVARTMLADSKLSTTFWAEAINTACYMQNRVQKKYGALQTSKELKFSQDYIVMPLWKDGSMFDSSSKNSCDDEPQPSSNAEKKDDKGVSKASRFSDQEKPKSSTPNINTAGPSINTASANFKTGRSATIEATHADLFVDLPKGKRVVGTKWIFRNKKDERGIVTRNKASLVAQGYTQEEGIDYDEVFAHVATQDCKMAKMIKTMTKAQSQDRKA
ncbi:retrovirus-related pol polyprotein from transposon TNT 1-94 [Tanacetum coccineum]|uniref:Retrovirus-related pol polyprotein from transposon TNT 1-94 n=1 Tax=Tanacetum coccineum TaxID=301880 RepID=A0ABQ5BQF9_9ASTR